MAAFLADPSAVYAITARFFRGLRDAGVTDVVLSPGSRSTPLSITARFTEGLRTWVELDERAAAFFALGLAKATGRPAVLVCTSGTAAANYLPAIVESHYARVPLIVATTDRPPELRDWGAGQTIDQVGLYGRYARWAVDLPVPASGEDFERYAGQLAGRSVATATGNPAGAVHLNWPLREPLPPPEGELARILDEAARGSVVPRLRRAREIADPGDVRTLAGLAREFERGVVLAGTMDGGPELASAVSAFASASGWPVLSDPASNLRAGHAVGDAPLLDAGDVLTRSGVFTRAHPPEVVVRIGGTPVSKAGRLFVEGAAPRHVWWLDQGEHWGEPSHRATCIVRGGAVSLLEGAAAELRGAPFERRLRERNWCREFEAANAVARKAIDDEISSVDGLSGVSVAKVVSQVLPGDFQLFSSNSLSIRLLDCAFANRLDPLRVFASRGASGIDGIASTALGLAAAEDRPTLLLTGDLAFLHDLSGLLLARRETIPLTIVVIDDNGGGIFSMLPVAAQGEDVAFHELFHTPHDVDLERAAALFEVDYHRVHDGSSLEEAVRVSIARPGVSIVHAPVDAKASETAFRATLARAVAAVDREAAS